MTQTELVNKMAEAYGENASKAGITRALQAFAETIGDEIADGGKVTIQKFGTFSAPETAARTGRNPHTGKPIDIPAGKRVKFSAASALKNRINE